MDSSATAVSNVNLICFINLLVDLPSPVYR
jgi:hypothetical protein